MVALPDVTRLFKVGQVVDDDGEGVAAMNDYRSASSQVLAKPQKRVYGCELGVAAQQHQPVIVQAHAATSDVVLRAVVDREPILPGQLAQVAVVPDIRIPLVQPVIIMIIAAETCIEDRGRITDAVIMPGLAP